MPNFASLAPFFSCKRAGTLYDSQGYFGTLPRAKRVKLKWLHQTPQSNTAGHPMASPLPLAATRWRRRFGRLGKYHAPQSMLQSRLKSALPGPFIFCMISPTFRRIGPSNPFLSSHSTRLSRSVGKDSRNMLLPAGPRNMTGGGRMVRASPLPLRWLRSQEEAAFHLARLGRGTG